MTTVRRLIWVGVLGGAGYAGWRSWQARSTDDPGPAPEWPPLDPPAGRRDRSSDTGTVRPPIAPTVADRGGADAGPDGPPVESSPADSSFHAGSREPDMAEGVDLPPGDAPGWVVADGGQCPPGYPIKANDNSGIYHRPGGRFYDRTVPERCYATAEAAEADGYRAAKQ